MPAADITLDFPDLSMNTAFAELAESFDFSHALERDATASGNRFLAIDVMSLRQGFG